MLTFQFHQPVIDGSEMTESSEASEDRTVNGGRQTASANKTPEFPCESDLFTRHGGVIVPSR